MASSSEPRHLTESYWPLDDTAPLIEHTLGTLLRERAAQFPDTLALVGTAHASGEQRRLTYEELHAEAASVASALLGVAEPGDFVALWAPNVVEWPVIMFGAAIAGVTLVALNPVLRRDELVYAINHSRATVLIHADSSRNYDMAAVVAAAAADCPHLKETISLLETGRWRARTPLPAASAGPASSDPSAAAMLQYTSGTTGLPKGVLLRHRSLVNVARFTMEAVEIPANPVGVNPLPMFHTASCVIGTLGTVWMGGTMVLIEQFTPAAVLDAARAENANVLFFVPTILGAVLEAARACNEPAPRLTRVLGGGANIPGAMIEATTETFGATVHNLFGQTELSPVLTLTRTTDSHRVQTTSSGRPLPQVAVKVVDPVDGTVTKLGHPGEVCARGYQQMIGYLDDPRATAAAVDSDGWLHTGDLGFFSDDGTLTITGRLKDLIVRGGENIAPAEIESCLAAHEEVREVAVVGIPDRKWGETVAAVIVPRGQPDQGFRQSLLAHVQERLSPYKVPYDWYLAEELPSTSSGKIQKFKLREAIVDGAFAVLD
ncbi:class I adenylate-forming enzyme family protein [Rhodococcus aetherivorans]|uniref:class I adenylate-forming enzyme family protein n=1 Tax=Rhodococcus aetherivorans TaxID=191292 RepID=UPI0002D2176A|nr:AMP-binding protein [Rhodococcus aetherivorans]CCW13698.1 Long-chain-fatty-acid--CoA ligase [Rhodococcus aetherivorans]